MTKRWWFWVLFAVVVYVLGSSIWIGLRALEAKNELEAVQGQIGQLKQQATDLQIDAATATLANVQTHTSRAVQLTGDPIWRIAEIVPFVGSNLSAVRQLAEISEETVTGIARPLVSVTASMDPSSFAPKDGAIDLTPLQAAIEPVSEANAQMVATLAKAQAISTDMTVGPVTNARDQVVDMLSEMAPILATLDVVVPLLPPAMGSDGPRNYALMFQNPAEPRALGGAALSFTRLELNGGKIILGDTLAASTGAFSKYGESVIPIPDGAEDVYPYGEFGTFIPEASARPSFTTAGEIVSKMWELEFGQELDGVLSVDPVALSYLLRATGPIPIATGDVLDEHSLVPALLNDIYLRYADYEPMAANYAHDAFYALAVSGVFGALTAGPLDAQALVGALTQGWNERRVLFWSSHDEEQALMAEVALNGELPVTDDDTVRAGLYIQDSVGSKLGFYLRQSVDLGQAQCQDRPGTTYRVAVQLSNTMDPAVAESLPFHITGEWRKVGTLPGVDRMTIRLYAPPGAQIVGATVDGSAIALPEMHDTDYPVGKTVVEVAPGGQLSLVYYFTLEGDAERAFEAQVTPLVTPTAITTTPLDCAAIP